MISRDRQSPVIAIVVAVAENGVIGLRGGLPWRVPSDLKTFRRVTMGKPLIMGRKTFETLKKPLDGRDNIVVTRDRHFTADGILIAHSFAKALELGRACASARNAGEVMIIGGAEIYRAALPSAQRIYWTEIHARPDGDVCFPPLDASQWREVSRETLPRGDRDEYAGTLKILARA